MDYSKNNDILKLISEILEYTENSTPSDTPPPCKCKTSGGSCGDDTSTCDPYPDGTYGITSCSCPNGSMIFCPKCPPPCGCKADGDGNCGDDGSECPDAPRPLESVNCYDSKGLVCNVCPKCPSVTPSPSPTICNCLDCGLWPYERDSSCWEDSCVCSYGEANPDCWYCPDTNTPTATCDTSGCLCDAGTNCEICEAFGDDCVNKNIQICGSDPDCFIECGDCVPKTTDTPSPTPTDTSLCPCDCSEFDSMDACEDFRRRQATGGPWYCHEASCDGTDCFTNTNCANLKEEPPTPSPTFSPTPSCPSACGQYPCGDYASGSGCPGCAKNSESHCVNCITNGSNCFPPIPCPIIPCDRCEQVKKRCGTRGYSTLPACQLVLNNPPYAGFNYYCKSCDVPHICTDGTPNLEECWCPEERPTITPTPTICKCSDFPGYADVGSCPAGAVNTSPIVFDCSNYGFPAGLIGCDLCRTPTPSPTCNCTNPDIVSPNICFESSSGDCKSYIDDRMVSTGEDCFCGSRTFTCPSGNQISCNCATCQPGTPTPTTIPTPTITPTPSCPPGCCKTATQARNLLIGKCADGSLGTGPCCKAYYYFNVVNGCQCYQVELNGSGGTVQDLGSIVGNNCVYLGPGCTAATQYYTCPRPPPDPPLILYPIVYKRANDGIRYDNCS